MRIRGVHPPHQEPEPKVARKVPEKGRAAAIVPDSAQPRRLFPDDGDGQEPATHVNIQAWGCSIRVDAWTSSVIPRRCFPPTDPHSATLVGEKIIITVSGGWQH